LEMKVKSTMNRDRSVGIETAYGLDNWRVGVRVPGKSRIITYTSVQDGFVAHTVSYKNGAEVNRPAHEADHYTYISVKVKKTWLYISVSPHVFMA
jgi:hypothetical protein